MKRVILDYATEEADEAEAYYNRQKDAFGK